MQHLIVQQVKYPEGLFKFTTGNVMNVQYTHTDYSLSLWRAKLGHLPLLLSANRTRNIKHIANIMAVERRRTRSRDVIFLRLPDPHHSDGLRQIKETGFITLAFKKRQISSLTLIEFLISNEIF